MTGRQRLRVVALAVVAVMALSAGPALAHSCVNSSKASGAGSVSTLEVTWHLDSEGNYLGETSQEHPDPKLNPQGGPAGAWFTFVAYVQVEDAEPELVGSYDIFIHGDLPTAVRGGGPGDDLCDGTGMDDLGTCLDELVAQLGG